MAAITQLLICSAGTPPSFSGAGLDLTAARGMLAGSRLNRHAYIQTVTYVEVVAPTAVTRTETPAGTRLSRHMWRTS
jgi:hypothetical protein